MFNSRRSYFVRMRWIEGLRHWLMWPNRLKGKMTKINTLRRMENIFHCLIIITVPKCPIKTDRMLAQSMPMIGSLRAICSTNSPPNRHAPLPRPIGLAIDGICPNLWRQLLPINRVGILPQCSITDRLLHLALVHFEFALQFVDQIRQAFRVLFVLFHLEVQFLDTAFCFSVVFVGLLVAALLTNFELNQIWFILLDEFRMVKITRKCPSIFTCSPSNSCSNARILSSSLAMIFLPPFNAAASASSNRTCISLIWISRPFRSRSTCWECSCSWRNSSAKRAASAELE